MIKNMNRELLKNDIKILELNTKICAQLRSNEIDTVGQLCNNTRKELRSLNFVQNDIQVIVAKLQLQGLDIKGNEY